MKKLLLVFIAVIFTFNIVGCTKKEDKKIEPTATASVAATVAPSATSNPTATAAKILIPKVSAKIDYTVLQEFKVFKQDKGYGALVLISPDASKEDIIDLLKKISENKDPVDIEVFTSREAYDAFNTAAYTEEFKKGYIASYTKNKSLAGKDFYGKNNITWTQEIGKFESLLFTTTSLDN